MCGRARLSSDVSEIKIAFGIPPSRPAPNFAASWNVAPTDPLPIVRYDPKEHQRSLEVMRWGLVPFWAKDIKVGFANINAKAEGIENKPAFREAFRQRRCLVPVDNFYEWKKVAGGKKQPYAIGLKSGGLMALAGLWESWHSNPSGERVRSFAIVTTEPNDLCAQLHNRMPVVLAPEAWPQWLGEEAADEAQLKSLLVPYPSEGMVAWPVSQRVGSVKNNDPSLIEPIATAG
jgi:putative SOS response-associated peptidase YedK